MKIDFEEQWWLLEQNRQMFEVLNEDIAGLKRKIEEFAGNKTVFSGDGAQAIGNYFLEVHGFTLLAILKCYSRFQSILGQYVLELARLQGSEPDLSGGKATRVDTEYVLKYSADLVAFKNAFSETSNDVRTFYNKNREFFSQPQPSSTDVQNELLGGITLIDNQLADIAGVDAQYANAYDDIDEMIRGIRLTCRAMTISTRYQAGSFAGRSWFGLLDVSTEATEFLFKSFYHSDGSINYVVISNLLLKGVDVLDYELAALKRLVSLENGLTNAQVVALFNNNYAVAQGQGGVPLLLAESFSTDATLLAAKLSSKGNWTSLTYGERSQLNLLLRRAQLLEFAGNLDRINTSRFDFHRFDLSTNAVLTYRGRHYQLSDARQLLGDNQALALGDLAKSKYYDQTLPPDRVDVAISLVLDGVGFIPGIGDAITTTVDIVDLSKTIKDTVQSEIEYNGILSNAEIESALWHQTEATIELGGGVAYVETTNGFRSIGFNMATSDAIANIQGLTRQYNLTGTQVYEIMETKKEPYYTYFLDYLAAN
jgi:hypothetical protein